MSFVIAIGMPFIALPLTCQLKTTSGQQGDHKCPKTWRRTSAGIDMIPTMTTCNYRIGLLLADGQMGLLRIEDAERVQVSPG